MSTMDLIISKKVKFKNPELGRATARIRKAGEAVRINAYKIAAELAKISNNKLWIEDGYEDVTDYANKILHIKKTMCYDLIKIGNTFVADNGRTSNLYRPEGMKQDYTVGQLRRLLPIGYEKAEELARDGIISPEMSVRTIQKIVRVNNADNIVDFLTRRNFDPAEFEDGAEIGTYADNIEVTTEIAQPEPVFTLADGELFTTDYFDRLSDVQLVEIINVCREEFAKRKKMEVK